MKKNFIRLVLSFSALLVFTSVALAQNTGAISGTVTDTSDAVLPGVAVVLSSTKLPLASLKLLRGLVFDSVCRCSELTCGRLGFCLRITDVASRLRRWFPGLVAARFMPMTHAPEASVSGGARVRSRRPRLVEQQVHDKIRAGKARETEMEAPRFCRGRAFRLRR